MTVFSFLTRTTKFIWPVALGMLIIWTSLALAVKPDPSAPGGHLLIKEVAVVVVAGSPGQTTFNITGQDFDYVNLSDLGVTLGEFGPLIVDPGATSTNIVATLKRNEKPFK